MPVPPPRPDEYEDLSRAQAENVLQAYCGYCHYPDAPAAQSGGLQFIYDWDRLVEAGLIVPLSSAASPLIRVMRAGSMPPPASGLPPVGEYEIQVVATYIDDPRYWEGVPPRPILDGGTPTPMPAVDAGADGG